MAKEKLTKILYRYRLDYILLALVLGSYYTYLQWNDYIGDPDGFYHAKIASFLAQGRFITSLPWMQFSSLRDHFTDQHLIYHLLQAPLTLINHDPLLGVKISAVIFATTMVLVFYWLAKKLHIVWPWFFSLLFITVSSLSFRLSLIKITGLSLIMVWLIVYALFKEKYKTLATLGFIYVWLYGGWPLAIFIFMVFVASNLIYDYIHHKKIKLFHNKLIILIPHYSQHFDLKKLGAYLGLGLVAGVIINPYFPYNLYAYYQQFVQIGLINKSNKFPVGGEWYGIDFTTLINGSAHLFAVAVLIFILLFFNIKKTSRLTWLSFLLAFAFLLFTMKSGRYFEYYAPFLLLFVASGLTDISKIISWRKIQKFWDSLQWWLKTFLAVNIFIFGVLIMPKIYQQTLETKIPVNPRFQYQTVSAWLKNNTPKDSIVFHSDWDEWPMLFYFNDHNRYIIGLDFTFMYYYDAELQQKYMDITNGKIKTNLSAEIKNNFNAQYIVIQKKGHETLINNLDQDPQLPLVYQDTEFNVYKINL